MARALLRTCLTTQQLVIKLRTQRPVVTDMSQGQTHLGRTTAIETWTCVLITAFLVLVARTVVDAIAADKHRKAILLFWTPKVCFGAGPVHHTPVTLQRFHHYFSRLSKLYKDWNVFDGPVAEFKRCTSVLIGAIYTLLFVVTECRCSNTLKPNLAIV